MHNIFVHKPMYEHSMNVKNNEPIISNIAIQAGIISARKHKKKTLIFHSHNIYKNMIE